MTLRFPQASLPGSAATRCRTIRRCSIARRPSKLAYAPGGLLGKGQPQENGEIAVGGYFFSPCHASTCCKTAFIARKGLDSMASK